MVDKRVVNLASWTVVSLATTWVVCLVEWKAACSEQVKAEHWAVELVELSAGLKVVYLVEKLVVRTEFVLAAK